MRWTAAMIVTRRPSSMSRGPVPAAARRHRWRRAVPLLLALGLAAAVLVAGEDLVRRLEAEAQEGLTARTAVGAGVVQQQVLRRLEAVEVLHGLAQTWHGLREAGNAEGRAAIERELTHSALAGRFGIVQVAMIDADGWMSWSSISGSAQRVFLGDREHFRVHAEGRQELFVSRPLLGRVSRRWTLQLTRPLRDQDGGFAGVAVVSLDLLNLSDALAEVHFEAYDRNTVVHRDGTVAARSLEPAASIGTRLTPGDPLRNLPPEASGGVLQRSGPDGQRTLTGWVALPGTDLVAAYVMDVEQADHDIVTTRTLVRVQVGALILAAFALLGAYTMHDSRRRARAEADRAATERRLSEEARETFARRIAGLPALVYGGIVAPDGGFRLTHVSESAARIVGWSAEELRRRGDWTAMIEPADVAAQPAFFGGVAAAGAGLREYRLRRPDGSLLWLRDSARVIGRRPDGGVEIVGYAADISEARALEARARAAGRLSTLGEMATGLAHELNQPLAVMSLAAENAMQAIERGGAEVLPGLRTRLARIAQQAQRARGIVDHLRVFGRRDEGEVEPTRLADAVEGAAVLTGGALRAVGIELAVEVPADLPPVMARLVPLEQALVNLVLNARDAIEARGVAGGRVTVAAAREGAEVRLTVSDTGGGIAPEVLDRMFEPFFTTKPPGKGTGLGLSMCHAAMRSFGGAITAANGENGAVFTLAFRLAPESASAQAA
jgi:PAS domain S-box-containing protein